MYLPFEKIIGPEEIKNAYMTGYPAVLRLFYTQLEQLVKWYTTDKNTIQTMKRDIENLKLRVSELERIANAKDKDNPWN